MSKKKKAKVRTLTDEQYENYLMALKDERPTMLIDKDGKRIERSIYSRPWIANASGEIPVTITIKGRWQVEETPFCKVISTDKKQTVLRFSCKDGASYDVELTKK